MALQGLLEWMERKKERWVRIERLIEVFGMWIEVFGMWIEVFEKWIEVFEKWIEVFEKWIEVFEKLFWLFVARIGLLVVKIVWMVGLQTGFLTSLIPFRGGNSRARTRQAMKRPH